MKSKRIVLRDVHLHYASVAYTERSIKSLIAHFARAARSLPRIMDIHALKGISLEVAAGERVCLLGPNGAGKSTFLKMVAGVYPISRGTRNVQGTVRALFDLSLGFEQDATGRENILYRGLLLGLSPRFMRRIEDEIVELADIGEFIDYPIKTYSAGMQVRLAFAISTAVGGDVLLLDEVIGAGDANFMAKAKRRILELVNQSEVMILATHDLASARSMCQRGVVLEQGRLVFDGPIADAIDAYQHLNGLQA
jgi:lipopolysaccharide transport system ATP-binding protein